MAPGLRPQPDILNYAWRDYGNRVGVWYLLKLFNQLKLPISLLVNSAIYNYCPEVIAAFRERGDEIIAHGYSNSQEQGILSQAEEEQLIKNVTQSIVKNEKKRQKVGLVLGFLKVLIPWIFLKKWVINTY